MAIMVGESREARVDLDGDRLVSAVSAGAFDLVGVGLYAVDAGGLIRAVNLKAVELLGWTPEQCRGRDAHETLHVAGCSDRDCQITAVARSGVTDGADIAVFRRGDGSLLPVRWAATPVFAPPASELSVLVGALVAFSDVTAAQEATVADAAIHAQVRSELGVFRQAVSDLGWAAEVTQALASAPDEAEALQRLTRMAVPRLCDVIVIHRIDESGGRQRVAVAAATDLEPEILRALEAATPSPAPIETVRHDIDIPGVSTLIETKDLAASALLDDHSQALVTALGSSAVMVVPMSARGHVVAVAELFNRAGGATFDETDRLVAVDLARRAGLAVDNQRLLQAERRAGLQLQRALLPVLPVRPGLRLAARYLPAGDAHQIGGDWYDAFACPSQPETTMLVIGDVAGHDLAAASDMAAIRNLLRGVAVSVATDPAGLLSTVDDHLDDLGIAATATAIVASVARQGRPGYRQGDWSLRWSNAGHLPPAGSGRFRTPVPADSVHRFRGFSYTPEEARQHPRLS